VPELREAILKHVTVIGTIAGQRDPSVMAEVATGESLDSLVRYRCIECPTVLVTTKADVRILDVLKYSAAESEVVARVESGWHPVAPNTGSPLGACHAQAHTIRVIMQRQGGVWKIAEGKDVYADRVEDTPELLAKYCSSN
jgi:hypothetical protein